MSIECPKATAMTKITARLFRPMYEDFDRQMASALLRRDAFLDRVLACEIDHISEDLKGLRQSDAARHYVSGLLKLLGGKRAPALKQVSISVRQTTADALTSVAAAHNISRDSLIN